MPEKSDMSSPRSNRLNVFISYSRDDLDFADQLAAALDLHNFEVVVDRHGISAGEDWQSRLGSLIRNADTIVFVLSPASARSDICLWEVKRAASHGKRIIPVPCRSLEDATPPQELSGRNYVFFYPEPRTPGSGFGTGLAKLVTALNTDQEWLREHTRLLQRATEWASGGRPSNRLLSGDDIASAKAWAARSPADAPKPTTLHLDFIRESESCERERQNVERQRLAEREHLVKEAESAAIERAAAQQRETRAARRVVQRTLIGGVVAFTLAILAVGFGIYALRQQSEAEAESARAAAAATEATAAREQAVRTRDAAVLAQSQYLADLSLQETERNNPVNGMLVALEALPDKDSEDPIARNRASWPPAEMSLELAS